MATLAADGPRADGARGDLKLYGRALAQGFGGGTPGANLRRSDLDDVFDALAQIDGGHDRARPRAIEGARLDADVGGAEGEHGLFSFAPVLISPQRHLRALGAHQPRDVGSIRSARHSGVDVIDLA